MVAGRDRAAVGDAAADMSEEEADAVVACGSLPESGCVGAAADGAGWPWWAEWCLALLLADLLVLAGAETRWNY